MASSGSPVHGSAEQVNWPCQGEASSILLAKVPPPTKTVFLNNLIICCSEGRALMFVHKLWESPSHPFEGILHWSGSLGEFWTLHRLATLLSTPQPNLVRFMWWKQFHLPSPSYLFCVLMRIFFLLLFSVFKQSIFWTSPLRAVGSAWWVFHYFHDVGVSNKQVKN